MSDLDKILTVVNAGFQQVNERLDRIEARVEKLESEMTQVRTEMTQVKTEMTGGFSEVHNRLDTLQKSVDRIEQSQRDEVFGVLNLVKTKTETNEFKIDSLNKRLLQVEATVEKFSNQ